jgi:hypothetical protein
MGSTFLGLVLGIIIAAFITTHYSDVVNELVRDLVATGQTIVTPVEPPSLQPAGTPPNGLPAESSEAVLPVSRVESPAETAAELPVLTTVAVSQDTQPELVLAPVDTTATVPPVVEPVVEQADFLERRWAEFAAQADLLQPVGDFRWRNCFTRAAAAYGVSEPLLLAVASGESNFDPAARSDKDAIGIMQIRWPDTSRHLGVLREADLYDPCTNVAAGARYLAELSERFGRDLHRTVAAYNYGPSRIGAGEIPEGARWYSQYIYQHLQQVLGKPHVPSSELVPPRGDSRDGFEVLARFNQAYRARDFKIFLESLLPKLQLAQRSEALGQHEVVLLYQDESERRSGLAAIHDAGLVAATRTSDLSISL